ncbi:MAG: hypothetical protein ACMXYK_05355 [Candidatus Woesearchaeota archaeon]
MKKIILTDAEPEFNPSVESLAKIITARLGLLPRKKGSTDSMHKIILEFYERSKQANRQKKPELAVMTVEEMSFFAGITKQTMYEYLERWLTIDFITRVTFFSTESGNTKKIVGYKLNGTTLEDAFSKTQAIISKNLAETDSYITELQRMIKNEKIKETISLQTKKD